MGEFNSVGRCSSLRIYVAGMPFRNEVFAHRARGRKNGEERSLEQVDEQTRFRETMRPRRRVYDEGGAEDAMVL